MHELSLCVAIANAVKPYAAGQVVTAIHVQLGVLRQVAPDAMGFCWGVIREREDLAESELKFEMVNVAVKCPTCDEISEISSVWMLRCQTCQSAEVDVIRGNEFFISSIDVSTR